MKSGWDDDNKNKARKSNRTEKERQEERKNRKEELEKGDVLYKQAHTRSFLFFDYPFIYGIQQNCISFPSLFLTNEGS